VGVVRQILNSFGGRATHDQIAQTLIPDVFTEAEFKRWFENTKKALKKDGHFTIPSKKSEAFELREGAVSHADEYLTTFRSARRLKDQINALEQILKNVGEFSDAAAQLQPLIPLINETARKSQRLHTSEALSLLLSRDELLERVGGLEKGADAPQVADFLKEEERQLPSLLAEVPAVKLKRVLSELPNAFGEEWPSRAIILILRGSTRLVAESARLLVENGHTEAIRTALDRAIREHSITSDALSWLAKERSGVFSDLATVRLLSAILSALERDQFSEKRDRKLHDQLMNDRSCCLISSLMPHSKICATLCASCCFQALLKS
jgi:transcription elongation factor GreA-like protein